MPSPLNDKTKKMLQDAFEKAAADAGFKMKLRTEFGDELRFSDFAIDTGTSLALNAVVDIATRELKRRGVKLKLGDGGLIGDIMPDRYAIVFGDKRIYGAIAWDI